jgi:hypothetical protein
MAINIDTLNIDDYPGITKRVVVDLEASTFTDSEGDEKYVINTSTTAYSDNTARTAIQDIYVREDAIGWCKSSGLVGAGGKFALDSDHCKLKVKIDNTVSGTDGDGYNTIVLAYDPNGLSLRGDVIAADMEDKIHAIVCTGPDVGYQLAYRCASVEFKDNKFWVTSGNIGRYYTGQYRSSVKVIDATASGCAAILGFNLAVDSETMAGISVPEGLITTDYTANTTPLYISTGTGVNAGDCVMITDGINKDYFSALAVNGTRTQITVAVSGTNGFIGITNNYTAASGVKIQILKEQDPDSRPNSWCESVDDLIRYSVKNIIAEIDYSS